MSESKPIPDPIPCDECLQIDSHSSDCFIGEKIAREELLDAAQQDHPSSPCDDEISALHAQWLAKARIIKT